MRRQITVVRPDVAVSLHASFSSESRRFQGFADLEFLNRPFRHGRRCLRKADELGRLSP